LWSSSSGTIVSPAGKSAPSASGVRSSGVTASATIVWMKVRSEAPSTASRSAWRRIASSSFGSAPETVISLQPKKSPFASGSILK
jgi:hypothetical protein